MTGGLAVFAFLCGIGCGLACAIAAFVLGSRRPPPPLTSPLRSRRAELPPATARAVRAARKARRLKLPPSRWIAPAREDFP